MHPIPQKLLDEILNDPEYKLCMRRMIYKDHYCQGRITFEHAIIYAGKQVQEKFAIISLCALSHGVDEFSSDNILDKKKNRMIAFSRATKADKKKYPRLNWNEYNK